MDVQSITFHAFLCLRPFIPSLSLLFSRYLAYAPSSFLSLRLSHLARDVACLQIQNSRPRCNTLANAAGRVSALALENDDAS